LRDNLFFTKLIKNARTFKGAQVLQPFKYQKGIASIAFSGFDVLPITQVPVSVNGVYYPSFVATNIALAGSDLSVNKTQEKVLDLMELMMHDRAQDAADDIGNMLQGDGTSFGGKAPMGLAGIVDNGSDLANYAGLSRATYSGLNGYVTTATNGVITLLQIRQAWNQIADGQVRPDVCITDYNTWGYLENLLNSFQRNMYNQGDQKSMQAGAGYTALTWDGLEIFRDKKITTGDLYLLNMNYLHWDALKWWEGEAITPKTVDIEGNVYESSEYNPKGAFTWTDWIKAYNQATVNGFIILGGQAVCTAPLRNAVINGITGS
jgi:hypothetical protein